MPFYFFFDQKKCNLGGYLALFLGSMLFNVAFCVFAAFDFVGAYFLGSFFLSYVVLLAVVRFRLVFAPDV